MSSLISTFILLFVLCACGTSKTRLTDGGKEVRILSSKKDTGCSVLEKVVGENAEGSVELAQNHARNLAAAKGGDALSFDETVRNGGKVKILATVFSCQE